MRTSKQFEIDYLRSVVSQLHERLLRRTASRTPPEKLGDPCGGCMSHDSGSCDDHYVLRTAELAMQGFKREHYGKRSDYDARGGP